MKVWAIVEQSAEQGEDGTIIEVHASEASATGAVDQWNREHGLEDEDDWCDCHNRARIVDGPFEVVGLLPALVESVKATTPNPRTFEGDTAEAATAWLRSVIVGPSALLGPGFHPEMPGRGYFHANGSRVFTNEEAREFDASVARAFDLCEDVYAICIDAAREAIGDRS